MNGTHRPTAENNERVPCGRQPLLNASSRNALDQPLVLCDISVMTEIQISKTPLPPAVQRFVLHWGEMGTVWGVNRSIGQIHALLYLAEHPLTAEDLAETLDLARSNVSNSLKELLQWGLIRRVSVLGDRRDFYEAEVDLWEMVGRIAEGRKTRELDPTVAMLRACMAEAEADRFMSAKARQRIADMLGFTEMIDAWATDMRKVPRAKLAGLMKLGSAILRFLPAKAFGGADPRAGAAQGSNKASNKAAGAETSSTKTASKR